MDTQRKTTYSDAKKRYYEKNKETIAEKEKDEKRWRDYYEKNKEAVKRRNLERYYAKQGRTPPAPLSPDLPPADDIRALIKRLQDILPVLTKAEKKKRGKSPPAPEATPEPVVPVSE